MNIFKMDSDLKKEALKYLSIIFISVILSTTASFLIIHPRLPAPGNSSDKHNYKTQIQPGTEKNFFYNTETVADISQKLAPSVVNIITKTETNLAQNQRQYFFEDDFFKRFFGFDPHDNNFPRPPVRRREAIAIGTGSGTIISSDGYILTNYHVVQNASEIIVKVKDKEKKYKAKVVGKDKYSDLAVIKINEKGLIPAKLSDSSKIRPGQWAIAIGSPHGLDHTVTLGIISAVSRNIPQLSNVSFIQTDAAINPGNSGGPLLNIKGEVVGINTAIMGTAQNIGFAIPINTAKRIVEQLKSGKTIGHPWLGIAMSPMTDEFAEALGVPKGTKGVVIEKVMRGSPADINGIQAGDILQRINGKKFDNPKAVQLEIKNKKVGKKITVQILRDNGIITKKIKLGNWGDTGNN